MSASILPAGCALSALSACGSSGASSARAVARVNGVAISKADLAHWTAIKRVELAGGAGAAPPTEAQAKEKALRFLLTAQWLQQEAAALGIAVAASETEAFYAHLLSSPNGKEFASGLRRRGLSRADELLVLRVGELTEKLRAAIGAALRGAPAAVARRRVEAFITAYRQRWKQRTSCEPGYVIAECRSGPPVSGSSTTGP